MAARQEFEYYSVLGLTPDADEAAIRSQYRRLAKQFHPDRNAGDPWHAEQFKNIHAAYATLSDPRKKAAYDLRSSRPNPAPPKAKGAKKRTPGRDPAPGPRASATPGQEARPQYGPTSDVERATNVWLPPVSLVATVIITLLVATVVLLIQYIDRATAGPRQTAAIRPPASPPHQKPFKPR